MSTEERIDAIAAAFRRRNPFYRDMVNLEAMIEPLCNDTAMAAMLSHVDSGKPPLAAVSDRWQLLLAPVIFQARADARARRHLHRMVRLCGSLVREVLGPTGCRKTGRSAVMPRHARGLAGRGALFVR
jgi:hypothetical protein